VWQRLDHLVVAVEALPAAERLWSQLLGRRASWRGEHPGAGTANRLFRLGNTVLELLAPVGSGPLAEGLRKHLAERGEGLFAMALGTGEVGDCARQLADRGLHPGRPRRGMGRDVESGAFREWTTVFLPASDTRGVAIFGIQHHAPEEVLPPAPLLAAPEACVDGLDHVVIRTRAPEAARALYADRLGLRLALDRRFPQWGVRLQFFRLADITVELAAELGVPEDPGSADRLFGLSWRVADADAARARLVEACIDVSPVRAGRKPGTRVVSVHLSGGAGGGLPTLLLEPRALAPSGASG